MFKRLLIGLLIACTLSQAWGAGPSWRLRQHYYRPAWTPYVLGASVLKAWWNAGDIALMVNDGGGLISSWKDRITGNAVTATTTARGTYGATAFNSIYPGITCNGTSNAFLTTTLTALPTGSAAGEVWAVGSVSSNAATAVPSAYGGASGASIRRLQHAGASMLPGVQDGVATNTGVGLSFNGPHIIMGDWSGTTELGYFDSVAFQNNPTTIATLATGIVRLRICSAAGNTAGSFFGGVIEDIIVIAGSLSAADRNRMEGYLAWQYGLAANLPDAHPYRWAPP